MIVSVGLRAKVERLLRGDIRVADIDDLFSNMREEAEASSLVREIGHFRAHPRMRDKGICTQEIRDLFAFLKFRVPETNRRIITTDLPASMPDALRANLRRVRPSVLKQLGRTNRVHAQRVLERILARMKPTGHGGLLKPVTLNEEEYRIFALVVSYMKGGALFTDVDLFKEFVAILRKQKLLESSEVAAFGASMTAISLFVLITMHGVTIDLGDGTFATISIAPDMHRNLGAFAFSRVTKDQETGRTVDAAGWLFQTGLPISEHCETGVAPNERVAFIGDFEINPEMKLRRSS